MLLHSLRWQHQEAALPVLLPHVSACSLGLCQRCAALTLSGALETESKVTSNSSFTLESAHHFHVTRGFVRVSLFPRERVHSVSEGSRTAVRMPRSED